MAEKSEQLKIYETFKSIQGESTLAGRLCFFIRLAGCNLKCSYCDTAYAQSAESGRNCSISELLGLCRNSGVKLIEITGGEPLLQKNVASLCETLLDNGFEVMMETNGSCDITRLPPGVKKILDCKLPSSGMSRHNLYRNYRSLTPYDEVKFVIADRNDYDFALAVIKRYNLEKQTPNLLASPVWGGLTFEELAGFIIEDNAPLRFQIQLHKVIWGDKPGV